MEFLVFGYREALGIDGVPCIPNLHLAGTERIAEQNSRGAFLHFAIISRMGSNRDSSGVTTKRSSLFLVWLIRPTFFPLGL